MTPYVSASGSGLDHAKFINALSKLWGEGYEVYKFKDCHIGHIRRLHELIQ